MIDSFWPECSEPMHLIGKLMLKLQNPPKDKFFVLQGILTEDGKMIAKGATLGKITSLVGGSVGGVENPSSLEELARTATPGVIGWIREKWYNLDLNIIIVDWAGQYDLVETVRNILMSRWKK